MFNLLQLPISENLSKPLSLPSLLRWRVSACDRVCESELPVHIRAPSCFFFARVFDWKRRACSLTRRGYLIIYVHDDKGFILDLQHALSIGCKMDKVSFRGKTHRRCQLKMGFSFGSVQLVLTNDRIELWRDALIQATESKRSPRRESLCRVADEKTKEIRSQQTQTDDFPFASTPPPSHDTVTKACMDERDVIGHLTETPTSEQGASTSPIELATEAVLKDFANDQTARYKPNLSTIEEVPSPFSASHSPELEPMIETWCEVSESPEVVTVIETKQKQCKSNEKNRGEKSVGEELMMPTVAVDESEPHLSVAQIRRQLEQRIAYNDRIRMRPRRPHTAKLYQHRFFDSTASAIPSVPEPKKLFKATSIHESVV